ncbi:putative nucleotide pyrophosphohydrolase [Xylophilus phage Lumi]|nr:putative nucleotide pyrophosphohydrolase [Xylophilus phage Lumi]
MISWAMTEAIWWLPLQGHNGSIKFWMALIFIPGIYWILNLTFIRDPEPEASPVFERQLPTGNIMQAAPFPTTAEGFNAWREHYGWPTYVGMVDKLLNVSMPGNHAPLMHGLVGMTSEINEFLDAKTRKNLVEELGDIKFYLEAARLHAGPKPAAEDSFNEQFGFVFTSIQNMSMELVRQISVAMDVLKKPWAYGAKRELDSAKMHETLDTIDATLNTIYQAFGLTKYEVEFGNMVKLLGTPEMKGRYHEGAYSDEQALARADKKRSHTVKEGEMLIRDVANFYHIDIKKIVDLNPLLMKDPGRPAEEDIADWSANSLDWILKPGAVLQLPDEE